MIDFYTWGTPNGCKVAIMLEETATPYTVIPVNIMQDEQFDEAFLKISPNNKIPAIVDHDNGGVSLMESGAILLYLANRTGQFISSNKRKYWQTMEWLMFQMGGLGPMLGQAHHFIKFNPGVSSYAKTRYAEEAKRLNTVLDKRLDTREYVAGEYSIADMAIWPWISRYEWQNIDLKNYPNVLNWYLTISKRPAVIKAYSIPNNQNLIPIP